jgi:hypothetical protein
MTAARTDSRVDLRRLPHLVMPGFMPGIHGGEQGVDGRDKPGHDERLASARVQAQ